MSVRERAALFAWIALLVVLALTEPRFFTASNLRDIALNNVAVLMTACGMLLVILVGQIDISVGSQFALCGLAMGASPPLGVVAGIAAGAINGFFAGFLGLPSIVVTLGMMVALRDAIRWATQGAWIQMPPGFQWAGLGETAGQFLILVIAAAIVIALGWALRNIGVLRFLYATGANEESARLSGIPIAKVRVAAFVAMGALTAIAALLNGLRFNEVQPSAGMGLELKAIAAVVVGGASIRGGRGSMLGTMIGVALLGTIGAALTFLGVGAYWEKAVQGAIILVAALLESWGERRAQ